MMIHATMAAEARDYILNFVSKMKEAMSNPVEYIEKGYWTFPAADELDRDLDKIEKENEVLYDLICNGLQTIIDHYGWDIQTLDIGEGISVNCIVPSKDCKPVSIADPFEN